MNKLLLTLPLLTTALLVLIIILQFPSNQTQSYNNSTCTLTPSNPTCTITTCWNNEATIQLKHFEVPQEHFVVTRNSSQIYSTTVTLVNGSTTFTYTNQNDTTFIVIYTFNGSSTTYTATVNYVGNAIFVNGVNMNVNGGYISTTGTTFSIRLSQGGTYLITASNGYYYTINGSSTIAIPVDQTVTYYVYPRQGQCTLPVNAFTVASYAKPTYIYITVSVS